MNHPHANTFLLVFSSKLVLKCAAKILKNIAVFSEKTDVPPPPKPVYGGNFSHEAVTL